MRHDLKCQCGYTSEFILMQDEGDKIVHCERCGRPMTRKTNKVFSVPQIQGDTVAGGKDYSNYYDPNLQTFIKSKQHRAEVMKAKGLIEYTPDPIRQKSRDEQEYIRRNAAPGDAVEASKAIKEMQKDAMRKAHRKRIDETFSKFHLANK